MRWRRSSALPSTLNRREPWPDFGETPVRLVRDMRQMFPRMTFIVTTHNPMALMGARSGEVQQLHRQSDDLTSPVIARRIDVDPRLRTGSELYKHFFQIRDLYPTQLGNDLRRYHQLASDPTRDDEDDADALKLLRALREAGIEPGFDPVSRGGVTSHRLASIRSPIPCD